MGKRPIISPKFLVLLLIAESFFLTYIVFNTINLVYVLIVFGITVAAVILLVEVVALYGETIELAPDLDDNREFKRFKKQLMGPKFKRVKKQLFYQ
ncbi:MAG: hypothetical protein ACFFG0_10660, partial [Candidatus Thorarchaeota archaeon]